MFVYKEAKRRELKSGSVRKPQQRHLRNDYNFRQVAALPIIQSTICAAESDSSSDEYNPTSRKRRVASNGVKPSKRAKLATIAAESHTRPSVIPSEEKETISPTLITLKVKSTKGKTLLDALARKHGSGYDDDPEKLPLYCWKRGNGLLGDSSGKCHPPGDHEQSAGQTYLQKKDEESGAIGERTNRSGFKRLEKIASTAAQQCTACSKAKRRCSLKKNGSKPCTRCYTEGLECVAQNPVEEVLTSIESTLTLTPAHLAPPPAAADEPDVCQILPTPAGIGDTETPAPTSREYAPATRHATLTGSMGASKDNPIVLDSPSLSPEPQLSLAQKYGFSVLTDTFFAHPMNFKHISTPEAPCHFCRDFRYGIYGYGKRTVELAYYPGESQPVECGNGWVSRGREPTRMCVACSLKRLYISRCRVHDLKQVAIHEKDLCEQYIRQLVERDWNEGAPPLKQAAYPTCALCPWPGIWRCFANQRFDRLGRTLSESEGKGRGCGLVLCDSCASKVKVNGILRKDIVKSTADKPDGGPRADMEFLFQGSLLHKAFGTKQG